MVLTRSASRVLENNMATRSASTTGTSTVATISSMANPVVYSSTTTTALNVNPMVTTQAYDISLSSEGLDQTVVSPTFESATAQNIRREVRESTTGRVDGGFRLSADSVQQIVEASVGICQARFMRDVDEKIQQALAEIKVALTQQAQTTPFPPTSSSGPNYYRPPPRQ